MTPKHQIVVSAENNSYMSWQCKLFYYSCVSRTNHQPIIIVHASGTDWHPDFYDLAKAGCAIYRAPSYRVNGKSDDYSPRNTAGTLLHAAEICAKTNEFIVLCDPDMIFSNALRFPETLSGDFCSYIDFNRNFIPEAKNRLAIRRELSDTEKEKLRCGVPYVIPTTYARQIGKIWLEAVDAFEPRRWEDIMYAFGLAVIKLGLEVNLTHLVDHNYWPDEKLRAPMIHYCHGDERWNKRDYLGGKASNVWNPAVKTTDGTIFAELLRQIREAGEFYRDPYSV
jgi:hypothetical protein